MIGYYNPSVILTYIGLIFSVIGIFQATGGNFKAALICLMVSGICDMFDGTIAKKIKRDKYAKSFGIQIDSLCDLVCFGVFPGIITYYMGLKDLKTIGMCVVCFYVLASVIRLGFYNVLEEVHRDEGVITTGFRGVPVTSVALILPLYKMIDYFAHFNNNTVMLAIVMFMLSFGFLINIPIRKPAKLGKAVLVCIGIAVFISVVKFGGKL